MLVLTRKWVNPFELDYSFCYTLSSVAVNCNAFHRIHHYNSYNNLEISLVVFNWYGFHNIHNSNFPSAYNNFKIRLVATIWDGFHRMKF